MSDNDIIHRRAVYDVGRLGAEEEAERLKQQEEEELAAMEEDDEEWFYNYNKLFNNIYRG